MESEDVRYLRVAAVLVGILAMPGLAHAATFVAKDVVSPADPVPHDLYGAGERITINHPVEGDAWLAGNTISVADSIAQDIIATGNSVEITGTVGDDVMAAGSTISIQAPRVDDIFAAGATIHIAPATIIDGSVYAAGENITLGGTIAGDVWLSSPNITFDPDTTIAGNLATYGPTSPQIPETVEIAGDVRHRVMQAAQPTTQSIILSWVRTVLMWFVSALVVLYVVPRFSARVLHRVQTQPLLSLGIGVAWLLLFIPLTVFLMISVIGLPLAALVATISLAAGAAAPVMSVVVLGGWLLNRLTTAAVPPTLTWQHALLGAVIFAALPVIPVAGWLAALLIVALTLGGAGLTAALVLRRSDDNHEAT